MFTGHTHHWSLPCVKCLSYYDIQRAGSHHLRKHGTFGLCCSIREQNKDFNCQLKRKILIYINICDINVFNDSEISHSKQIKFIKTSTSFWHLYSNSQLFIWGIENWSTSQILKSYPESGGGTGKGKRVCYMCQALSQAVCLPHPL